MSGGMTCKRGLGTAKRAQQSLPRRKHCETTFGGASAPCRAGDWSRPQCGLSVDARRFRMRRRTTPQVTGPRQSVLAEGMKAADPGGALCTLPHAGANCSDVHPGPRLLAVAGNVCTATPNRLGADPLSISHRGGSPGLNRFVRQENRTFASLSFRTKIWLQVRHQVRHGKPTHRRVAGFGHISESLRSLWAGSDGLTACTIRLSIFSRVWIACPK